MVEFKEDDYDTKYTESPSLTERDTHYCPGCEHGTATHLIAMALDELGLRDKTIMCDTVGCSVLDYYYFNVDHIQCAHGRGPAVATGVKRMRPDLTVYTVQGDGDAGAIGMGETVWTAIRGEPITVFLINNAIYGMTGGQMAPTTLPEQVTTTTPYGRDIMDTGRPVDMCKLLSTLDGPSYVRRVSLVIEPFTTRDGTLKYRTRNLMKARQVFKNAFEVQQKGGYAFVEAISTCSINWKMKVMDSKRFANDHLVKRYPLGVYIDRFGIEGKVIPPAEDDETQEGGQ